MNECSEPLEWHGMYSKEGKWKKYLDQSTNAHPAKGSMTLFNHIIEHLEKLNLLKEGDKITDFMAGTSRTGVLANLHGYDFLGVELEDHFIKMSEQNKAQLNKYLNKDVSFEVIKGDARKLSSILKEKGAGIVSPPYGDTGLEYAKNGIIEKDGKKYHRPYMEGSSGYTGIVSPPYSQAQDGGGIFKKGYIANNAHANKPDTVGNRTYSDKNHNFTEQNIGNLRDSELVGITSPPYENDSTAHINEKSKTDAVMHSGHGKDIPYGKSSEQLGALQSESYLSAMSLVYAEAFKSGISPLTVVVKNPTKKGKLRRLDLDTKVLLEQVGYRIFCEHHAMLFEERKQRTLAGGIKREVHGRLSFFKRLSYNKGNAVAQWENVITAIIPTQLPEEQAGLAGVTSPPYAEFGIGDYKEKREAFVKWIKEELKTKMDE